MLKNKLRVFVIDDDADYCDFLKSGIEADSMLEVVGACSISDAGRLTAETAPDIITLEPGSPSHSQFELAKHIITEGKAPVIIISAFLPFADAVITDRAKDCIKKRSMGDAPSSEQLMLLHLKLKTYAEIPVAARGNSRAVTDFSVKNSLSQRIIVMGASLGGTEAIMQILSNLPPTLPGIVIVQHMPESFTGAYAQRLNQSSSLSVKEAKNGDRVLPGTALIAPGGRQLTVHKYTDGYAVRLGGNEKYGGFCPSVDVLFHSAAVFGKKALGVILTGMGHDGAEGIRLMHENGAYTIGQNRESCAVFGMPCAAEALGGIDEMLCINDISDRLIHFG